jgi:hypothetical protein
VIEMKIEKINYEKAGKTIKKIQRMCLMLNYIFLAYITFFLIYLLAFGFDKKIEYGVYFVMGGGISIAILLFLNMALVGIFKTSKCLEIGRCSRDKCLDPFKTCVIKGDFNYIVCTSYEHSVTKGLEEFYNKIEG